MVDISNGIDLFNDSDFFSAHDFFEDVWMDARSNDKEFFQGLVQISVGCYHLICGNLKGANSQLNKGITKLSKYEPNFYKIDLTNLINNIKLLLDDLSDKDVTEKIPTIELITN